MRAREVIALNMFSTKGATSISAWGSAPGMGFDFKLAPKARFKHAKILMNFESRFQRWV